MPCWYFDKSDLSNTPSFRDGLEPDIESRYRREGARFIMDCGNSMGLRYDTMATGVVFYHRFFMFHSFNEFPRYVMATCCLFLAGKVEETPKKSKDLVKAAKTYLESKHLKKYSDSFGDDPCKDLMTYEKILLQTIKFDLQVDHPYGYLLKYAKTLKGDQEQIRSMVQMAWAFINDSYCTTLCLQWEPEIIAIALMYLTSKLSKFEVTDWIDKRECGFKQNWWDQFVEDLGQDILEDICHQILDLYATQQQQQQKQQLNNKSPSSVNPSQQMTLNATNLNGPLNNLNKRKSPPDSLSLTPNSSVSSVGYHDQASPTSAKLMKSFSEPNQNYQYYQNQNSYPPVNQSEAQSFGYMSQQPVFGQVGGYHPASQPPPPPPQAPYSQYNYYSHQSIQMMMSKYPQIPSNIYPGQPGIDNINKPVTSNPSNPAPPPAHQYQNFSHMNKEHAGFHPMYNQHQLPLASVQTAYNGYIKEPSHSSNLNSDSRLKQHHQFSTNNNGSGQGQVRSSALKTVDVSDRPV